ncbi:hypothetical protein FKG96_12305 [Olivibacter sp. LS-1]|uniref:hypothetical protein n=1 Tax=Olivibacter sp. LS-1 TaxID=2592345 RepID=UPI0011EAF723|nr:hypothetical protein [Olivibacter sp. LS-1]QEL01554.1 hypothetical protein FKG96_12305 [Olivibacter sp. LS-1]
MSYIKTKSETSSLIIVDEQLYVSNNPNIEDGETADGEIVLQLIDNGRKLFINAGGENDGIELNEIQLSILKNFLSGVFN